MSIATEHHMLIVKAVLSQCHEGHVASRWTSDAGTCSCGKWECWTSERQEIDQAHDAHLAYVAKKQEQTFVQQRYRGVSLHELFFRGPDTASCKGCSWMVHGMDASRIREAFSHHLETVRKEFTNQ
jgi:hypothetical protein